VFAFYAIRSHKPLAPSAFGRCLAAVVIAVVPVYSMLFVSADLANARYVYLSTVFWVLGLVGAAAPSASRSSATHLVSFAIACVAASVGVHSQLTAWKDAAALRDRVLAAAQAAVMAAPCDAVSLAGAPDSLRGAFVFRNGLDVALGQSAAPAAAPGCTYMWNGNTFVPTPTSVAPIQARVTRPRGPG
jgi:hypothetical protein